MNEKWYLLSQINRCRRKLNLALFFAKTVVFLALGGLLSALLEAVSLFVPFYSVHVWAACAAAVFLVAGIVLAFCKRKGKKDAALALDGFGLKERVITAYEHLEEETEYALLQREDAVRSLQKSEGRIRIRLNPGWRRILALVLSMALAVGLAFVPTPAREVAKQRHLLAQEAKEKQEELEKLVKKLEQIDTKSLTAEQKATLAKLTESMKLSAAELKKSKTREALNAAEQKLDYKYKQAVSQLGALASQLKDPKSAGVASAEAMAKAASGNKGNGSAGASASGGGESGTGGGSQQSGSGTGDGDSQNGDSGNGSGTGDSENGGGNGTGNQGNGSNGSGDGNSGSSGGSQGNGGSGQSGSGNGNGSGANGSGNGSSGSGRGTGSSSASHDYVSVPNQKGNDDSLHGNKTGSDNSDYYREQNGLAWEGDHVSLDSVVGDYTKDAYEGLSSGKYPSGMESVIKDYFKNLNE